jgi:3-dehydroquinate synthase
MMRDGLAALAPEAGETTIGVGLAERSYDIVIGRHLLDGAGARIAATLPGARCAVVSDATVAALYLDRLKKSLGGLCLGEVMVAPGETSKSFPVLA